MVSVIVPVYNVEEYLEQCIQSIVNQTYSNIEILILDDGSTDDSGKICLKWQRKDHRIVYVSKKNEGLGETRNLGVKMARGDVLAFVDSDDWIAPDFISIMLEAMCDCDMVFCDYFLVQKHRTMTGRRYCRLEEPCLMRENPSLLFTMGASTCNKLYRRNWWLQSNVVQPTYAYEDTGTMPVLWEKANKIAQVSQPLYYYRIDRAQSITNDLSKVGDICRALSHITQTFKQMNLRERYRFYLDKYCAMALSVPLSRIKNDVDRKYSVFNFYYQLFPEAKSIDEMSILILGSMHGEYCLEKTCFLRNSFQRIEWTQDWQSALRTTNAKLIMLDFAGEVLPDTRKLAQEMKSVRGKLCILDSKWMTARGLYGAEMPFEQLTSIQSHNHSVEECCNQLRALLPQAVWLSCNAFNYTDAEFPLGCMPMYRNNFFYYSIVEQLWAVLRSLL